MKETFYSSIFSVKDLVKEGVIELKLCFSFWQSLSETTMYWLVLL